MLVMSLEKDFFDHAVFMRQWNLAWFRKNQVRSHLDGLFDFSYEHIIFFNRSFLKKVRSHLAEPDQLTGLDHLHMHNL